jgi:hypothetical protein
MILPLFLHRNVYERILYVLLNLLNLRGVELSYCSGAVVISRGGDELSDSNGFYDSPPVIFFWISNSLPQELAVSILPKRLYSFHLCLSIRIGGADQSLAFHR